MSISLSNACAAATEHTRRLTSGRDDDHFSSRAGWAEWWTSVGRRGGLGILVQDDVALMCVTVAVDGDADGARAVAAQQG